MKKKTENKFDFWLSVPTLLTSIMVFLLPLFFLPETQLDFLTSKAGLLIITVSISILIWAISKLKEDNFSFPINLISLSIILLPITYLISAFYSGNVEVSILGKDLGPDSVAVFSFLFLTLLYISMNYQEQKRAVYLNLIIFSSIFLVLFLHLLRLIILPYYPVMGFFFEASTNTIGRWYDLGILAGLGSIISITSLELFKFSKVIRAILFSLLVLSLTTLAVVGFQTVWIAVGVVSVIIFVYIFSLKKIKDKDSSIPVTSLVTFLLSFLFLISGPTIYGQINNVFNVSFLEARPSFSANIEVLEQTLKESPVLGTGPTMFNKAWNDYKPDNFNMTELWSADFRYGYSTLLSFFVMGGILGILAWVIFLGTYLFYGFKALFTDIEDSVSRYVLISSFISSMFMWVMTLLYVPSFVNLALTFILSGVFVGSLYRENMLKVINVDITKSPKAGFIYIFSIVALLLIIITGIWHFALRVSSAEEYRDGLIDLNLGNIDSAENAVIRSISFYPTDNKLQTLNEIGLIRLNQVINNQDLTQEDRAQNFRNTLSRVISNLELAIAYDPENYQNYNLMGSLFESLIPFGIEGSYEESKASYELARELNPKNPAIVLSLARLEFAVENNEAAREYIREALNLKGNYTAAIFLLSQIDVAEGDIDQAIANVSAATQIRPNDPLVFFQLGILRYQNENYTGAVTAFESAVILNNFYDNARYFLGLSYEQENRTEEAIVQFEILEQRYPQNEEIKFILSNLRDGVSPFTGASATEEIDDNPEDAEELPIDESEDIE
jgi:tetratricopeptide (TPR) repeat protein